MTLSLADRFHFELPDELAATEPPEERGLPRDGVRLMVARSDGNRLEDRWFADLPSILERGDILVVNTSATLPAALRGRLGDGRSVQVHLAGRLPEGTWAVELRHPGVGERASTPWLDVPQGASVHLPEGASLELLKPSTGPWMPGQAVRLWSARVDLGPSPLAYLAAHGRPIRYGYVERDRPIGVYQTVFAEEPGSAEMPSAARPFSAQLVTRLAARGVGFAPFVLHCGVSSPEAHEPPAPEWYRVPAESAAAINTARAQGHRVVAVGTTAVRALETVADASGAVHPGSGWTHVVVSPARPVRTVDGLITGWHEPQASHLDLLQAVAGRPLLEASYTAALARRYLWHEFGDSHLILR
jgi:S-adenosylmethionine:tRNA ribosyltransferase-isomerase